MRLTIAAAVVLLAAAGGLWMGERDPLDQWTVGTGILLALSTALGRGSHAHRAVALLLVASLYAAAVYCGHLSFRRAFNECVERGEEVRQALASHRARFGQYPPSLGSLPSSAQLCRTFLGRTILRYERGEAGYRLVFSDWLVSHEATDAAPFVARK